MSVRFFQRDPRERGHPHARSVAAGRAVARDRRRPHRRRRRHARDGACRRRRSSISAGVASLPGFTDSHVHFVAWALAQHEVRFEGTRTLEEAVERVRAAVGSVPPGGWLRGRGWRERRLVSFGRTDTAGARRGHRRRPDGADGARRPFAVAELRCARARATATCAPRAASSRSTSSGEPTGVLREESAWLFREKFVEASYSENEALAAVREGLKLAASRGVTAIHAAVTNEDRWIGGLPFFEQLDADDGADAARVAVDPAPVRAARSCSSDCARASAARSSGSGR